MKHVLLLLSALSAIFAIAKEGNATMCVMTETAYQANLQTHGNGAAITIAALQGIVNKSGANMFVLKRSGEHHDQDWLELLSEKCGVKHEEQSDLTWYLDHFAEELSGYVLFSFDDWSETNQSTNVALSLAGLTNAIPIERRATALVENAKSLGLALIEDVSERDYAWLKNDSGYWAKFSRDGIVSMNPGNTDPSMRDFGVARGMAFFWDSDGEKQPYMELMCAEQKSGSCVWGWCKDEPKFVIKASEMNLGVIACDWATNLSVYQHFDAGKEMKNSEMPPLPTDLDKHYVAVIMSDGDNVQAMMNHFTNAKIDKLLSPQRGKAPLGWQIPPMMYGFCNPIIAYVYSHLGDDVAVAGPTGYSYYLPARGADVKTFSELNSKHLAASDVSIVTDLDHTHPPEVNGFGAAVLDKFTGIPEIEAVAFLDLSWNKVQDQLLWSNGKPIIATHRWGYSKPAPEETENLARFISGKPKDATRPEGYTLVYAHAWTTGMADVVALKKALDSDVVMVRPDVLFALIGKHLNPRASSGFPR